MALGYFSALDMMMEVIVSGVAGFVSGLVINVMAEALAKIVPDYAWLIGLVLLVIIPLLSAFSDAEEMMVRGVLYCLMVMFASAFIFYDMAEVGLALVAALLSVILSYYKNTQGSW